MTRFALLPSDSADCGGGDGRSLDAVLKPMGLRGCIEVIDAKEVVLKLILDDVKKEVVESYMRDFTARMTPRGAPGRSFQPKLVQR